MALVPVINRPSSSDHRKRARDGKPAQGFKTEKILFLIIVTIIVSLTLPDAAILVGCLMLATWMKECGVERIKRPPATN